MRVCRTTFDIASLEDFANPAIATKKIIMFLNDRHNVRLQTLLSSFWNIIIFFFEDHGLFSRGLGLFE